MSLPTPPPAPTPWPRYPLVYEINTRVWLRALSQQAGRALTLATVPDEALAPLWEGGFHALWLMGVWSSDELPLCSARAAELIPGYAQTLPDLAPEDVVASPYAISRYEVAAALGGAAALATLRERLARRGVRLILDFVSNHTACDHPLVRAQPAVFIGGTEDDLRERPTDFFRAAGGAILAHGRDPYFPPWRDTVAINYAQPAGRAAMLGELRGIAAQCDGVRCDMAMLILPEVSERLWGPRLGEAPVRASFWREAIAEITAAHPTFLFLGEAYWGMEPALHKDGFHFTYDKTLYDRLVAGDADGVRAWLGREPAYADRCARFVENHDEPRAMTALGPARAPGAALVTFLSPGLRLFHDGQFEGHRVRLPVQLLRAPREAGDGATRAFYRQLLAVLRHPDFQGAGHRALAPLPAGPGDGTHGALVAIYWPSERADALGHLGHLIVVNLGAQAAYARLPLPGLRREARYLLRDLLDGKLYPRSGEELGGPGLFVALPGHGAHVLALRLAPDPTPCAA